MLKITAVSRKSCITLIGPDSSFFVGGIGLRQCKNLGSILFCIFLNDFETYLHAKDASGIEFEFRDDDIYFYFRFVVLLYTDDTVILSD